MSVFVTLNDAGEPIGFWVSELYGERGLRERPVFGQAPEPTEEVPNPSPPIIGYEPNPEYCIPRGAIEITEEAHADFLANQGLRRWDDTAGSFVVVEPPAPVVSVEQVRAETQRRIVAASAEALRNKELFDEPVPQEVKNLCAAIRTRGAEIEAMDPLPADVTADELWIEPAVE